MPNYENRNRLSGLGKRFTHRFTIDFGPFYRTTLSNEDLDTCLQDRLPEQIGKDRHWFLLPCPTFLLHHKGLMHIA